MANLEELVVSLVAETSGLRTELQKATEATKTASSKMDDALKSFSENSSKNLSFFETAMASMTGFLGAQAIQAVLGFVGDGLGALKDGFEEGIKSAIAQENALKRLANSMALSGQYSQQAMLSLQGFTDEMEALTGVSDDVIASNLAVLSSLTKLDAEGLKRAQKAALDMSVALGMDLESATQLVAKGIEGNVSQFKRYGIEIEAGASKAENLSNVLNKLEDSFGGAAAGAAQTFGGAWNQLKNAVGNFNEALATAVTNNPVVIAMMTQLTQIINNLTGSAQSATEMLQAGFAAALLTVVEALGVFAGMLDTVFGGVTDKFAGMRDALAEIHGAGDRAFNQIGMSAEAVTPTIQNQKTAVDELSDSYQNLVNKFASGLAEQGAALDNEFLYEQEAQALHLETQMAGLVEDNAAKAALREEDFAFREEQLLAQQAKEWEQLNASNLAKKGNEEQYNAARTALEQKHHLEFLKQEKAKTDFEAEQQKIRSQNQRDTLNYIATLQSSSSKELAAIGKAAAMTTATIDGIVAVQKALSAFPPPFNFVAAALVGVAAAANVAKIAGVSLNEGGKVVGGGANADTVPAMLTKGENVTSRDLTNKMEEFFADPSRAQGGGQVTVELVLKDSLVEFIEAKILERQATKVSLLGSGVV